MGLSPSLYIGPYVHCQNLSAVDINKLTIDLDEVLVPLADDNLLLWQEKNKTHIWILNRKLVCQKYPEIQLDYLQSSIQEIPIELPKEQIFVFKQRFREELAKLAKVYGGYNMDYKWGIINQIY